MFLMVEENRDGAWVRVGKRAWPNTDNGWFQAWLTITVLRLIGGVAYYRITPYSL